MRARDLTPLAGLEHVNPQGAISDIQARVNCLLLILQALEGEPQPEPANITAFRQWAEDVLETLTVLGYGISAKKHRERLNELTTNVAQELGEDVTEMPRVFGNLDYGQIERGRLPCAYERQETEANGISLNLAQRQQDFEFSERRAAFALECLKAYSVSEDATKALIQAITEFVGAEKG